MTFGFNGGLLTAPRVRRAPTPLNRQQIAGFWAAWFGWMLDGMDSVIYALVMGPALTELLPKSGMQATPANIGYTGSLMFGLFLVGWGLSFIWGPISDRFGRTRSLAATTLVYAVFTGAAAFAPNVWMLALFRFLAGIGVGGEWAMAGTYVAEAWPEDRRKMGAGYLQTGYYFRRRRVRLARHVPVRACPGRGLHRHPAEGEGAGAMGKARRVCQEPAIRHFQPALPEPHHHHVGPADHRDRRPVGRRGV
jgi:hypothetical protein